MKQSNIDRIKRINERNEKRERKKRRRRIRTKVMRIVFFCMFLCAALIGIGLSPLSTIQGISYRSEFVNVSQEEVAEKLEHMQDKNVISAMNFNLGAFFRLRFVDAEQHIEQLPYVRRASVRYSPFRRQVNVRITEREVVAVVQLNDVLFLADQEGFLVAQYGVHSGQHEAYSGQHEAYSGQHEAYSGQDEVYAGQDEVYSEQDEVYSAQDEAYSAQDEAYSEQHEAYFTQYAAYSGQYAGALPMFRIVDASISQGERLVGSQLPPEYLEDFITGLAIPEYIARYDALQETNFTERLRYIDISDSRNIRMQIGELHTVEFGALEGDIPYKISFALATMENNAVRGIRGIIRYDKNRNQFNFIEIERREIGGNDIA